MLDQRTFRGLGDAPAQCAGQQNVRGVGTTDYACGFLRGWQRIFTRAGFPISIDGRSQGGHVEPVGPAPTMQEWGEFDAQAASLGVGGLTAQLRKNATPSTALLSQISRGLSTTGRGLEAGRLDKALKGASQTLVAVGSPLDKVVPGSGAILTNAFLALLAPGLLPSSIAGLTVSSTLPLVGSALSGGSRVAGTFVAPSTGTIVAGPTAGAQAVGVYDPLSSVYDVGQDAARALGGAKGTLAKGVTVAAGDGALSDKLLAAGLEATAELSFAITVVTALATGGAAIALTNAEAVALNGAALALAAVKGAYTVGNALRAADALKSAAKVASAKALADEAALDREIAELQRAIAQVMADTAALSSRGATPAGTPSGTAKAVGLILLGAVAVEVLS